jgi:SHS2 domain-containing protein
LYETFEHTADLGLRTWAADLNMLFAEAGQAPFATLVENLDAVAPVREVDVPIVGDNHEYLLFD